MGGNVPAAIEALTVMAETSREAADALRPVADTILRFIVVPPSDSVHPRTLAEALLQQRLDFYTVLASYGFYARLASTAQELLVISHTTRKARSRHPVCAGQRALRGHVLPAEAVVNQIFVSEKQ